MKSWHYTTGDWIPSRRAKVEHSLRPTVWSFLWPGAHSMTSTQTFRFIRPKPGSGYSTQRANKPSCLCSVRNSR